MTPELYSVEQAASLLGLHVRTVRNYVHEGKLKAVRIGKQYRIAREDLAALTGRPASSFESEHVSRRRHVEVASIVEIDAISPEDAGRIANGLVGAAKNHDDDGQPLRVETIYNQERGRLKVIVSGSIAAAAWLLRLIAVYLEP